MFRPFITSTRNDQLFRCPNLVNRKLTGFPSLQPLWPPTIKNLIFPFPAPPSTNPFRGLANGYASSPVSSQETPPCPPRARELDSLEFCESVVHRYRDATRSEDAWNLHVDMAKSGWVWDLFCCNTLINVYARAADMLSAYKVFAELPQRSGVTWACLISGYTRNEMPQEAFLFLRGMVRDGLFPTSFGLGSVLRACQESGPGGIKLGMQIHGWAVKSPCIDDVVFRNALISMYGKFTGFAEYANRAFEEIKDKCSISWNSIISVYSQRGDADTVFELFSSMQKDDSCSSCRPTGYTYGSVITAACSSKDSGFSLLAQMLSRVTKSGFVSDLYVGSALVNGFARLGGSEYAVNVMEQMTMTNAVSLNGLMAGLVRQKHREEALKVFLKFRKLVEINLDSYVILLTAFSEFAVKEEGRRKGQEVHGHVVRTGLLDVKVAIGNGLINVYSKCGAIGHARSVFRLMVDKDVVSWNSVISALYQNNCCEDAVASYQAMRISGLLPSKFSLISGLSSCTSLGWIIPGQQIHLEGIKLGLDLDVSVSNALLALYAETGFLANSQKIFSLMPQYDQVSWNTIIGALSNSGVSADKAVELFLEMMRAGWDLNHVTFINILTAVSSLPLGRLIHQMHALALKCDVTDDTIVGNALMASYGRCGEMAECEKIFNRMSGRRDEASWSSMISGYIHNDCLTKAMDLVRLVMEKNEQLDSHTFATILSACASVAELMHGMEVHACAIRSSLESDVVVGSAIVDMYAKRGRIDYASKFFNLMPKRNLYSWNSMISGFARHGHGDEALKLFSEMKLNGQLPDSVTFVGVLSACSHVGMVDEGFKHFKSMSEVFGLAPGIEHYSCMVDLLGRAGELDKMENFINAMPMEPNIYIWRTVLGACSRAGDQRNKLGSKAAEMLLVMEPQNATNYVLLSNMYSSGGRWDEMAKARRGMQDAVAKKDAGGSWVA